MKLTALAVLFATTILLTGAIVASSSVQYADAMKGQGVSTKSFGSTTKGTVCGDRLCSDIPGGKEAWEAGQTPADIVIPRYGLEQKGMPLPPETVQEKRSQGEVCNCAEDCNCDAGACTCSGEAGPCMCGPNCNCGDSMKYGSDGTKCNCSEDGTCSCGAGCTCDSDTCSCGESGQCSCGAGCNCSGTSYGHMKHCDGVCSCGNMYGHHYRMSGYEMKSVTGVIQSETDPGQGHELHQLAVLLAPSEKMYKGMLTYSASENVQLVALHGPLTEDQVMGQTIWTPDGKTKFALTLVDQKNKMGTWMFTGNALAAHTFSTEPFSMSYSLHYAQVSDGHAMYGSCDCAEGCSCDQEGACICSGEAGPCMCGPNCNCGDSMKYGSDGTKCNCSEDGTCSCGAGCTCDSDTCSCGESGQCSCGAGCNCSGTSYGHMKHCDGVCSCGNMYGHHYRMSGYEMKSVTGVIQSETDPGQGHELHQLAVLLAPSEKMYKGMLTYSASENVQLVALHGPLTEDQVMGQTIWTPDGKTKFALTLVDQKNKMGTWMFTGNALAAHTFSTEPFGITYSIVTMGGSESISVQEKRSHGAMCDCAVDCNCDAEGVCTCSGEAGPCMCGPNCNCGTDETCQCAEGCSCDQEGACICSGEAGPCMCGPNCNCGQ
ncbi:MAG: hypothetical protein K5777_03535 [Nitrosopumilus sp.]|nr:hypothetical protein [Nitrosopumilus sp.]